MYKNYIFDLYGTLLDIRTNESKPYLFQKISEFYSANGAIYTWQEFKKRYLFYVKKERAKSNNPYYEHEIGNVFSQLFLEKDVTPNEALIQHAAQMFRIISRSKIAVYDGVFDLFDFIHGKGGKVFLLSNAQALFTLPELKQTGLYECFDGVLISSEEKICKPDTTFMEILMNRYHLNKSECIMIGNDRRSDIKIANDYGIDSIYLMTDSHIEELAQKEAPIQKATYEVLSGVFRDIMLLPFIYD
jgi:putative hydrolase of the HAD superfamily